VRRFDREEGVTMDAVSLTKYEARPSRAPKPGHLSFAPPRSSQPWAITTIRGSSVRTGVTASMPAALKRLWCANLSRIHAVAWLRSLRRLAIRVRMRLGAAGHIGPPPNDNASHP